MRSVDLGQMIVSYNFVIGVLLFTSSTTLASYAGVFGFSLRPAVEKYTAIALKTTGASWALLSGTVYIVFHILRIAID